jgi:LuxR family quorum-sensing system transcriptional regulator CciR
MIAPRALGFQYFALIDHVGLSRGAAGMIHLDTYPAVWSEQFIRSRLFLEDPVLQASLRTHMGFAWDDLDALIPVNHCHRLIFDLARKGGIGSGFTVPANIPGEIHGSCSFATRTGCRFPDRALGAAHLVGAFAYQAARRLHRPTQSRSTDLPKLTSRQRECVVLAGRGKSDWMIGPLLGLTPMAIASFPTLSHQTASRRSTGRLTRGSRGLPSARAASMAGGRSG